MCSFKYACVFLPCVFVVGYTELSQLRHSTHTYLRYRTTSSTNRFNELTWFVLCHRMLKHSVFVLLLVVVWFSLINARYEHLT